MIMKNKVIISIIPSIELQSVKLLLKGNFCSILIKCWIKCTPFLLKTGTFITLKNCIFMNDIELFSTLQREICMQHLKTSRIYRNIANPIYHLRGFLFQIQPLFAIYLGISYLSKIIVFNFTNRSLKRYQKKKEFCFSFKFYNHKPYTTKKFLFILLFSIMRADTTRVQKDTVLLILQTEFISVHNWV